MQPPRWFLEELAAFDPDLRLRWSTRSELWALERRVRRSLHPGTSKGDPYDDDYIRARDGFVLVGSIPPRGLHRYVFQRLRDCDLWSNGGWARVADSLDDYDLQSENSVHEAFEREYHAISCDLYNIMAVRDGRRVYNAGNPS